MPWKECDAMSERMMFVSRLLNEEKMSDLCREFGISRKTGYKIFERYKDEGLDGLKDQCRSAKSRPNETSKAVQKLILELKADHPTWGAPKIKAYLEGKQRAKQIPACSTIHVLLTKHNLVTHRKRRMSYKSTGTNLEEVTSPNALWCTDFKGQFLMKNRQYCYPLTITDQYSRYLLGCEGLERIDERECIHIFEEIFSEFGVPDAIRSDNGVPFASRSYFGISKLSVFWIRLGIRIERSKPGCPQDNGRHERMHRTLKQETTKPPGSNLLTQQDKFEVFKDLFNKERPHQALEMKTPSSLYRKSSKKFTPITRSLEYPEMDKTCLVGKGGAIRLPNRKLLYVGEVFIGENVGIKAIDEDVWRIDFMHHELGFFNLKDHKMEIAANPFLIKTLV
jgi:transposase InsO family protein